MQNRTRAAIVATAIVGVAAVGGGVALAAGGGDDDGTETPITGEELDRASAAALEHTGEGRVTETEKGDEESLYEVEVTRPDGSQADVQLDREFRVVSSATDDENED
jgi:uncharacterized membrane protein YkoI